MLNKICFTIGIISICAAVMFSMAMIWSDGASDVLWRGLLSSIVFLLASLATLSINRAMRK